MFFAKKEMDKLAAKNFWLWFSENEEWLIKEIGAHHADFIWNVDAELKPIFPYCKKELEFQFGFGDGKGEFFFFYMGDKNLKRDAETLKKMMPPSLSDRWNFLIEK